MSKIQHSRRLIDSHQNYMRILNQEKTMFARPHSDRNQSNRVNSWTHKEEVFLIGAVMQRWFSQGSLSRKKNIAADAWVQIQHNYDSLWEAHCLRANLSRPVHRSSSALSRHFKIMKSSLGKRGGLRSLYLEFELKYNHDSFNETCTQFDVQVPVKRVPCTSAADLGLGIPSSDSRVAPKCIKRPPEKKLVKRSKRARPDRFESSLTSMDSFSFFCDFLPLHDFEVGEPVLDEALYFPEEAGQEEYEVDDNLLWQSISGS